MSRPCSIRPARRDCPRVCSLPGSRSTGSRAATPPREPWGPRGHLLALPDESPLGESADHGRGADERLRGVGERFKTDRYWATCTPTATSTLLGSMPDFVLNAPGFAGRGKSTLDKINMNPLPRPACLSSSRSSASGSSAVRQTEVDIPPPPAGTSSPQDLVVACVGL